MSLDDFAHMCRVQCKAVQEPPECAGEMMLPVVVVTVCSPITYPSRVALLSASRYLWNYFGWRQTAEHARYVERRHAALEVMLASGDWAREDERQALLNERTRLAKWLIGEHASGWVRFR